MVEIKHSSAPGNTKSLRTAARDLQTRRNVIAAPAEEGYPLGDGLEVLRGGRAEMKFVQAGIWFNFARQAR